MLTIVGRFQALPDQRAVPIDRCTARRHTSVSSTRVASSARDSGGWGGHGIGRDGSLHDAGPTKEVIHWTVLVWVRWRWRPRSSGPPGAMAHRTPHAGNPTPSNSKCTGLRWIRRGPFYFLLDRVPSEPQPSQDAPRSRWEGLWIRVTGWSRGVQLLAQPSSSEDFPCRYGPCISIGAACPLDIGLET